MTLVSKQIWLKAISIIVMAGSEVFFIYKGRPQSIENATAPFL